ncbi:MAG TPA: RNA polymerase factor sigma-32 [Candidatus Limnocylindrales bacterium]|nr:RNA polymerase factor sigma-32 [Candidatus Limnocylindrales bacterium]
MADRRTTDSESHDGTSGADASAGKRRRSTDTDKEAPEGTHQPKTRKRSSRAAKASAKTVPPKDAAREPAKARADEAATDEDDAIVLEPEVLEAEILDDLSAPDFAADPDLSTDAEPAGEPVVITDDADDMLAASEGIGERNVEVQLPTLAAAPSAGALVPADALSRYLAEIRHYPLLSREEEHELAVRYAEEGDRDAAVKLITSNLRLVVLIAREYQRAFHNLLDLVQEGNVGLLEAVKQFDPYRGVRFPSYAVWWIRAYIIRYVMNNFRLVKVGTTQAQRRLFFNLNKEKARLEAAGFKPTSKMIAENLGVKEREVIEMDQRLASSSEMSVETPLTRDEDAGTMLDVLRAPGASAEEEVAEGEFYALMKEKLGEFAETLKGREAEIFQERLVAENPLTLQELGDRYGVSRERVRQMEAAVKKKLREYLVSQVRDLDEDMVV